MPSPTVLQTGVTVGTTATALAPARFARESVLIQNGDAAAIFIGGSTVTAAGATAGYSLAAGADKLFEGIQGTLFAISAAGTAANSVKVLEFY